MKIIIVIVLFIFGSNKLKSETYVDTLQMAGLCKVWGLLKYYHPDVAKKRIDWDNVLINQYDEFAMKNDSQTYNQKITKLIDTLTDKTNKKITIELYNAIINDKLCYLDNFNFLSDTNKYINQISFSWINSDIFSKEVKYKLAEILLNYKPVKNKYLRGNTVLNHVENNFEDLDSITTPYKILALFRYWNIINYFFPYKHLSDYDWDIVILQAIPKFVKAKDYEEYIYQLKQLSTKINDSHGFYNYTTTKYYKKRKEGNDIENEIKGYIPYNFKIIDDNIVISKVLVDSAMLNIGDTVTAVNKLDFLEYKNRLQNTRSFSTTQSESYTYEITLSNYYDSKFNISVIRNRDTLSIIETQIVSRDEKVESRYKKPPFYYSINDAIGYVELTQISTNKLKKAFTKFKDKKNIIFDLRGYPETIAPILLPHLLENKSKEVAKYYYPNKKYPGIFINKQKGLTYNYWFVKPFVVLKKRYKGKITVLINNEAISYSETVCMIFKSYSNNVKFVGTPTSGANGNVVSINMPGGISFKYSSLDWHFPDGKQLQRIGIIPDIYVKETVEGLKLGKDEILEKAIQYIKNDY